MGEVSTIQESKAVGNDGRSEVILKRLILVCIAITAGISGIAIVGWMLDRLILAGISTNYIPMAQSSALLFIVLSGALLVYTRQPASPRAMMIARAGVFLVILICLIIFIDFFTGMKIDIERVLINRPEKIGLFPIDRMSPISAANFLLAGSALLLLLTSPAAGRQRARGAAAFLATIVISAGFVVLLGYLYGTPLLYGGTVIPVALNTAIVFVFLGIGIMLAAGQHYWPLRSFMGSSVNARLLRVFLPLTIALVLIVSFLDVVIFQNVGNHVIVSSLVTILSVIILGIIIPKISHLIGSDIERANFEKDRAVMALQESESCYRRLFEAAHDGILLLEADTGKITDVNPFLINILGYSYDEFLGKELWEIGLFKDIMASKAAFLDLQTKGYVRYEDLPLKTKDGRSIDFEFVSNVYLVNNKKVIQCNIRDITERKQMEKEHDRLFNLSLDMFCVAGFDGYFKQLNPAWEKTLGWTNEELMSKPYIEFVHPDDREPTINAASRLSEGRIVFIFDNRYLCKDGSYKWISWNSYPLVDEKLIFAVVRDVTGLKQTDEELKKHREHLEELVNERTGELRISREKEHAAVLYTRNIIETSLDPLVTISPEGKITDVNQATEHVTGFARDKLIGTDFSNYFAEPDKAREVYQEVLLKEFVRDYPLATRHKSGKITDVLYNATVYRDKNGEVQGVFAAARDITERKKEEETRLENLRLEAADKAKSEFLANMSHELRTPLNSSIGFSELLKDGMAGELSEKQKHYVDNILISNQFLLTLINDILDISKIEAGKIELVPEKMSVPVTIKETLSLIKEKAMKHNVLLKTEFDPQIEFIQADKQRFKQILFNLLSNAVKFSKEMGGTITITVKKEGDMAQISVSDTGIGIKKENVSKLFHKFEQLESGISKKYGGTGLGLAITKQLVELHGGKIWAESQFGEGTTFTFLLPILGKISENK